jgi:hypothetical protein
MPTFSMGFAVQAFSAVQGITWTNSFKLATPLSVHIVVDGITLGLPLHIDVHIVWRFPEGLQLEIFLVFVYEIPLTLPIGRLGLTSCSDASVMVSSPGRHSMSASTNFS